MNRLKRLTCEMGPCSVLKTLLKKNAKTLDDCRSCGKICKKYYKKGCESCPVQKAFDRLAEYERTGITAEQMILIDKFYTERCEEIHKLECEIKELRAAAGVREEDGKEETT